MSARRGLGWRRLKHLSGSGMTAISRVLAALAAVALAAAPSIAFAQSTVTPAPTTNSTNPDAVGPTELQNFSLKGTVTRQADEPPVPVAPRQRAAQDRPPAPTTSPSRAPQARTVERTPSPTPSPAPTITQAPPAQAPTQIVAPPPVEAAPVAQSSTPVPAPAPVAAAPVVDTTPPSDPFAAFRGLPVWPWVAAAVALALGGAFVLWRRRPRGYAFAGSQFDLLEPEPQPEPTPLPRAPAPVAAPAPRKPAAPAGIVASGLRPALELGFHPLRCQVDDDQVAIEFELELFNAGTAPARAVLAEASMLNAGASQEQDLAAFFGNPNGVGERLAVIQPMKRVSFRSQVVAPRDAVQEYELAGRKSFVPVIAFNALYEWSGGSAQSSAAYLVGRDTQQDKLGPLRLDQGAREFRELGARPLPSAVRT